MSLTHPNSAATTGMFDGGSSFPSTEWGMHVISRSGAPPLRFTGRRIFYLSSGSLYGETFISLWQMKRQGFVLEHTIPITGAPTSVTLRLNTIPEALDALEDFCSELQTKSQATWDQSEAELDNALRCFIEHQQFKSRIRGFLNLAGYALAVWDGWCLSQDASPGG